MQLASMLQMRPAGPFGPSGVLGMRDLPGRGAMSTYVHSAAGPACNRYLYIWGTARNLRFNMECASPTRAPTWWWAERLLYVHQLHMRLCADAHRHLPANTRAGMQTRRPQVRNTKCTPCQVPERPSCTRSPSKTFTSTRHTQPAGSFRPSGVFRTRDLPSKGAVSAYVHSAAALASSTCGSNTKPTFQHGTSIAHWGPHASPAGGMPAACSPAAVSPPLRCSPLPPSKRAQVCKHAGDR